MMNSTWPTNLITAVFGNDTSASVNAAGIDSWLSNLSDREQKVINMRYKDDMTLEAIGKEFNVTRERIRQVEAKALRKLSHPSYSSAILMVSQKEHEELKKEYMNLLREYNALKRYVKALQNTVSDNLPQLKEVFEVMTDTLLDKGGTEFPIMSIDDFDFSVRTRNCLSRAGIESANELEGMSLEDLKKIRNLGLSSIKEISTKLKAAGFKPNY